MRSVLRLLVTAFLLSACVPAASGATEIVKGAPQPAVSIEQVLTHPLMEEPRGPNVFIWYCCGTRRFHSIALSEESSSSVRLYWGFAYSSVALQFPNCRGGKVNMIFAGQNTTSGGHLYGYTLSASLFNNAQMANCEVIAAAYQGEQVVDTISFRVIITP